MDGWNPRYVAYARAHGETPAGMLERDRREFPGGCMAGFTTWVMHKWARWRADNGIAWDAPLGPREHAEFDAWLEKSADFAGPSDGASYP